MSDGPADWPDISTSVFRMPVPSSAFTPFPSDKFRAERRLHFMAVEQRHAASRQLVGQALEELGRTHLALCIAPGPDCDECFWLSKAVAAARAGGWLR